MTDSRDKILNVFTNRWVLIFILIGAVVVYSRVKYPPLRNRLRREGRYTVATIKNVRAYRGGTSPEFVFNVEVREYNSSESSLIEKAFHFSKSYIGKRYFVIYLPNDPEICSLLPYNPVPDTLSFIPKYGWENLPIGELTNLIK